MIDSYELTLITQDVEEAIYLDTLEAAMELI